MGGFYLTYESEIHYTVHSSALEVFGEYYEPILGTAPETRIFDNDTAIYELDTWAIFGELYWQTTDNISMTLGLRTTEEEKKSSGRIVYLRFQDDPFSEGGGYSEQSGDWSEPTGKFNVSWDASDDIMVYATLSTSYKSGGANPLGAENPVLDPDVGGICPGACSSPRRWVGARGRNHAGAPAGSVGKCPRGPSARVEVRRC